VDRLAADALDLGLNARQDIAAARRQHDPGAALGRHAGGGEADPRGGAGDHDDLLAERLVLHAVSPMPRHAAARGLSRAAPARSAIDRERRMFLDCGGQSRRRGGRVQRP
jgi:hypothetical protein